MAAVLRALARLLERIARGLEGRGLPQVKDPAKERLKELLGKRSPSAAETEEIGRLASSFREDVIFLDEPAEVGGRLL